MNLSSPAVRLSGFYFFYYAALGAFSPYWGLFLKARGMDVAAISVLMSLWYATRIVAPTTWTTLAARSPQPIRWLRIGCLLTLLGFSVFLMPMGFSGLFAAMALFCFTYNAVMPQFEAITLSHLSGRSERYGLIRVWGSIGFMVVVASYGVLLDHWGITSLPWLMLPLFVALLASSCTNDYARAMPSDDDASGGFFERLKRPDIIAFFVVCFLTQVSFGPYYTYFSIYLADHGWSTTALGAFWSIGVLVEIAVFFMVTRIFARWSAKSVLIVALLSAALRWLITAWYPDSLMMMLLAQITHAINFAGFFAAVMVMLATYFPGRLNSHAQGLFYGFSSGVGGVAGALLAGQLWHYGEGRVAFIVAAVICLVAAAIGGLMLRRQVWA